MCMYVGTSYVYSLTISHYTTISSYLHIHTPILFSSSFQQPSIKTLETKLITDLIAANNFLPPEQRCSIRSINITIKIKNTNPTLTTTATNSANKHAKLTTANTSTNNTSSAGVITAGMFQQGTINYATSYNDDDEDDEDDEDDDDDSDNYDSEGERIYPYRDIHRRHIDQYGRPYSQPGSTSSANNSLTLTDSDQLFINSGSIVSFTLATKWEDIHETIIPSKYMTTAPRGYDEYGRRVHKNPLIQTPSLYGYNFEAINESIQKKINQIQVTSGVGSGEEGEVGNKRKRGFGQDTATTPTSANITTSHTTSNTTAMQEENDDDDEVVFVGFSSPVLPHTREHCPEYIFDRSDIVCSNNIRKCDKCYCYICDVSASECKVWRSHCNASAKGQLGHIWKQLKEAHTTSNTTSSSGTTYSSTNQPHLKGPLTLT